jgi:hypothetical protein
MEDVAGRVAILALRKALWFIGVVGLYFFFLGVFAGGAFLIAPYGVELAALFGYKTSEVVIISGLLGGALAGTFVGSMLREK